MISGGLDSQLAARLVQQQGLEVEALHLTTVFAPEREGVLDVAKRIGARLTVCALEEDYLNIVRNPRFGYGRAANPCLDCRIFMFRRAHEFMQQIGAEFVVTGEVAGQAATGQRRRDLEAIAHHSGLRDRLLRPLSAKILAASLPEREGWVDRERFYGFFGRGRRGLTRLAREMGIDQLPAPSNGCALSELQFARKTFDLLRHVPDAQTWDFKLLKQGRHFRCDDQCKVIVGRNEAENRQLEHLYEGRGSAKAALLMPEGFVGPVALVVGAITEASLAFACGLMRRFSRQPISVSGRVRARVGEDTHFFEPTPHAAADSAENLAEA
ncbi:MAG: hypothetical protein ACYC6N_10625 [Pirellulaceae bacterium]